MAYSSLELPEVGKLISLRKRIYQINKVDKFETSNGPEYLLTLEDIESSEIVKVIYRAEKNIEIDPRFLKFDNFFSEIEGIDPPEVFEAFIKALKWSSNSIFYSKAIKAPFYSRVKLNYFQLDPLVRAITMPKISLLIADDVGLGKTIEAGLIIQELILRNQIKRVLIICPAALQEQWKREMKEKFSLDFKIMNLKEMTKIFKEYGVNVNPWTTYPRIITSMDFIKQEKYLNMFRASVTGEKSVNWDFLVIDEAHNVMPKPTKEYYKDSDRTKAVRELSRYFTHKVFLTATPHNGSTRSFIALLEMLDPRYFNRGQSQFDKFSRKRLYEIMVRRLKNEVNEWKFLEDSGFPKRYVKEIEVEYKSEDEKRLFELLNEYIRKINVYQLKLKENEKIKLDFTLMVLKKRLLSSYFAFYKSLERHIEKNYADIIDDKFIDYTVSKLQDDSYDNDLDRDEDEKLLISGIYKSYIKKDEKNKEILKDMHKLASKLKDKEDSKLTKIYNFIEEHLIENGNFNNERLIIFTEYKDTLDYLHEKLSKKYGKDRLAVLYGGMDFKEREEIKLRFETDPEKEPLRILVVTDVASEGINLQNYCRYLIHYEIPWNPIRLEQRNGRIHRIGQDRDVFIYHFVYKNNEDYIILKNIIKKIETIKDDIDSLNALISDETHEAIKNKMLLKEETLFEERRNIEKKIMSTLEEQKIFMKSEISKKYNELKKQVQYSLNETKQNYEIYPESKKLVLSSALKVLTRRDQLEEYPKSPKTYYIKELPKSWKHLREYIEDENKVSKMISFEDVQLKSEKEHIHLSHPLMKKSISFFRTQIWNFNDRKIKKFTIKFSNKIDDIAVNVYLRTSVSDNKLDKITEDIDIISGYIIDEEFLESKNILNIEGHTTKNYDIQKEISKKVRKVLIKNENKINEIISKRKEDYLSKVKKIWRKNRDEKIKNLKLILENQLKEIDLIIKELERMVKSKKKQNISQISLFEQRTVEEEISEIEEDIKYLKRKKELLKEEIEKNIDELKNRSINKDIHMLPIAIEVIVPDSLIMEG